MFNCRWTGPLGSSKPANTAAAVRGLDSEFHSLRPSEPKCQKRGKWVFDVRGVGGKGYHLKKKKLTFFRQLSRFRLNSSRTLGSFAAKAKHRSTKPIYKKADSCQINNPHNARLDHRLDVRFGLFCWTRPSLVYQRTLRIHNAHAIGCWTIGCST